MDRLRTYIYVLTITTAHINIADAQPSPAIEKNIQSLAYGVVVNKDMPDRYKVKQNGSYQETIRYCENVIPVMQIFDREKVPELYMTIAKCYNESGQYSLALANYLEALDHIYCGHSGQYTEHTEAIRNRAYVNMSGVYNTIGDYSKSIEYCNKAIPYFKAQKSYRRLAAAEGTKAIALRESTKSADDSMTTLTLFKSAYNHSLQTLSEQKDSISAQQMSDIDLFVRLSYHLSDWYIDKKMPDSAAFYLDNAQRFYPFSSGYAKAWLDINTGRMYALKKNWKMAEAYLLKVLNRADHIKMDEIIKGNVHYHFYELFSAQGKFDKALKHYRQFHAFQEKSKELEKVHSINNLEVKYLTERKDREIAEKQLQLRNKETQLREKNILLYTASAGILLLTGMSFAIYRSYRNKKLLHRASLLNMEQKQKITNLQSRVAGEEQERNRIARELHDGTVSQLLAIKLHLNTISARNKDNTAQELQEVTQQVEVTAQELRQTTHNLMPSLLLSHGLTNAVAFYCDKVQDSSGLAIHFQSIGEDHKMFTKEEELSIFRILQELIQNVLKHAQAGSATVQLSQRDHILTLTVEDNGIGYSSVNGDGLGLRSIEERVQLLNGTFDIRSTPGKGTTAYVEIQK